MYCLIPHNTKICSKFRDPVDLFESLWVYAGMEVGEASQIAKNFFSLTRSLFLSFFLSPYEISRYSHFPFAKHQKRRFYKLSIPLTLTLIKFISFRYQDLLCFTFLRTTHPCCFVQIDSKCRKPYSSAQVTSLPFHPLFPINSPLNLP